jgi:hypothetical protein
MKFFVLNIFLSLGLAAMATHATEDLLIEDFEMKHGDWAFEGSAFTGYGAGDYWQPGRFDRGILRTRGHRGYALLKSWGRDGRNVDGETGEALSPLFKVERNFIMFMISGGRNSGRTCVNLLVDDKVVRSATGNNSNLLQKVAFEVSELKEKEARIQVLDRETGPWGHICIDDLIQTDDSSGSRLTNDKTIPKADTLWTQTGRQSGELHWKNGHLFLSGNPLRLEDIQSISRKTTALSAASPHAVHFRNGETWQVEILTLKNGKLAVKGDPFGERTIDLPSVRSLEFSPKTKLQGTSRPGVLYRTSGRPLPGKLTWIKKDDIAIDCALGIIPLPRTGLVEYIIPGSSIQTGSEPMDEIGLVDGSILRGKVGLDDEKIILEHPVLETVGIQWDKLRYLIRSGKQTQWLTDFQDRQVDTFGPLGKHRGVEHLDFRKADRTSLSAVRVIPQTMLRYKLPTKGQSSSRILRTSLCPVPGSLGDATISLSLGKKEFYKKEFLAEDETENISIPLPSGNDLVVRVEFGERLAYPCGVDMHDAHLVWTSLPQQGGQP